MPKKTPKRPSIALLKLISAVSTLSNFRAIQAKRKQTKRKSYDP